MLEASVITNRSEKWSNVKLTMLKSHIDLWDKNQLLEQSLNTWRDVDVITVTVFAAFCCSGLVWLRANGHVVGPLEGGSACPTHPADVRHCAGADRRDCHITPRAKHGRHWHTEHSRPDANSEWTRWEMYSDPWDGRDAWRRDVAGLYGNI